jgi:hypothetical protein
MDIKKAFEILEINEKDVNYLDIDIDFLKKKYHKLALINHPDKNNNSELSTLKFKEIKTAYDFLIDEFNLIPNELRERDDLNNYKDFLSVFLESAFYNKYNDLLNDLIRNICSGYLDVSLLLFDNFDKETTIAIYSFLVKYKAMLHLSTEILDKIKQIVIDKYNNITIYKINPTLKDLYENNIYKLCVNNTLFHVPLWHSEMYFDCSGSEIIVICEPQLPENVEIDEDNNIYIHEYMPISKLSQIIKSKKYNITVYNKQLSIPVEDLFLRETQQYIFKNQGISVIKPDIYDVTEKSNLIIKIHLV